MTMLESDAQKAIRSFNLELALTVMGIFLIGLFTLHSATHGPHLQSLVRSQGIRFFIGCVVALPIIFIDSEIIKRLAYVIYGVCLILLVAVLMVGNVGGGSQRWIDLGFVPLQPSELAKIGALIVFARYFSEDRLAPPYNLRRLLVPGLILAPSMILILVQPDIGTAGVLFLAAGSIVIFLGLGWRSWTVLIVAALITVPVAYRFGLKEYQRNRVVNFLDPGRDPRGTGYNAVQTRIAVGSGKVFGKGYMKGTQSQLNFIPEQHTDFIFSVFAEEHGFIGSVLLLFLYFLYGLYSLRTVARARDKFELLLAFGCTALIFWHVFINIGMVIGILPIVGVTLPFMSYGGSSVVTFLISTALILNISRKRYMF